MDSAHQASLSFTISWSLLKLMSIESGMPTNHLVVLYHPLLLLPLIFPSIKVFSNESVLLIMWPNYWKFSFSISPPNEDSGLISFMIDWFKYPEYSLEGPTLKLKHQYFGQLMRRANSLEKTLMLGRTEGGRRKG